MAKNIGCPFGDLEASEVGLAAPAVVVVDLVYNLEVILEVFLIAVG